jgi:hypothetical protein
MRNRSSREPDGASEKKEEMRSGPSQTQTPEETGARPKRRWEQPRILSREPLEAVAAVCAPSPPAKGNPGLCPSGPISS